MRLIDADYVDEKVGRLAVRYAAIGKTETARDYNFVSTVLETAPTMDAEIVVHCKDCKHRKEKTCANPCYGMWVVVELKDDDFCSYGERRNDV